MTAIQLKANKKKLSYWEYLRRLFFLVLFTFVCFILIADNSTEVSSFISSSISFLLAIAFATIIFLKDAKWLSFFVLAYIIKVFIGLVHYLYFIDGSYFDGSGAYKALTFEYDGVFNAISTFANLKLQHGIFYFDANAVYVTHPEILSFISIPFMFFGNFVLSITPINAFFSLLISFNIMLIAKNIYNFNTKKLKYVAFITAYFPITLISSLLWRDVIGISLMSVGITLLYFSKKSFTQYLFLIVACFLFYVHRTVYPILLVIAFLINLAFNRQSKNKEIDSLYRVLTIAFAILLTPLILNLGVTEANARYATGILNFNPLILPLKIVLGFIGPFPWTNFMLYESIPPNAYQLQDYLQGTFNISFVIVMFRNKFFRKKNLQLLNLIGFFLILSGLMNSYMHMPYIAFGFMFIVPWLFTVTSINEFKRIYLQVFIGLIVLNIVVVLILGNLGLSSLWK